jgi:hypothetical protein
LNIFKIRTKNKSEQILKSANQRSKNKKETIKNRKNLKQLEKRKQKEKTVRARR